MLEVISDLNKKYKLMKKIFLFILLLTSQIGIGQSWTHEELERANTAKDITVLNSVEKDVIKYLNLARLYPQKFAKLEVENYYGPTKWGTYLRTSKYRSSLLMELKGRVSIEPLYFDLNMYLLAKCYAIENGKSGKRGHTRLNCKDGYDGECISYGLNQAKDIALQLLVDHNVPSLGHRKMCLDGNYTKVGLCVKPHTTHSYCCVLDFKRKY